MTKVINFRDFFDAPKGDDAPTLKSGDGGGTYSDMSIIDAKIAASEARTDTKFAELMGELRVISGRIDNIDKGTAGLRLNVWLAAATALGLGIAAMALGASHFGNGVMVTTATVQDAAEAKSIAQQGAAEVRALRNEVGAFIQAIQQGQSLPQVPPAADAPGFNE